MYLILFQGSRIALSPEHVPMVFLDCACPFCSFLRFALTAALQAGLIRNRRLFFLFAVFSSFSPSFLPFRRLFYLIRGHSRSARARGGTGQQPLGQVRSATSRLRATDNLFSDFGCFD